MSINHDEPGFVLPAPLTRRAFLKALAAGIAGLAALRLPPAGARADSDGLLFHASFDRGPAPDFAAGPANFSEAGARFWRILGAAGRALVGFPGAHIRYVAAGNILPASGTLEFGVKLLPGFAATPVANYVHVFFEARAAAGRDALILQTNPRNSQELLVRFVNAASGGQQFASGVLRRWTVGSWHHLALTWDAAVERAVLYADGAPAGALRLTEPPAALDGAMFFAGGSDGNSAAFAEFDDLRIYDRARSAEEIAGDVAAFDLPARAGDTAAWPPGAPALISTELLPPAPITIALISDTHVARAGVESQYSHTWRVEAVLNQVQSLRPDLVVHGGDMTTNWPDSSDFNAACDHTQRLHSRLTMPIHYVAGNHDIGNKPSMAASVGHIITEAGRRAYRDRFGPDYYAFDAGPARCLVINAQLLSADELPAAQEQWAWLRAELEAAQGRQHIFLFMHLPPFWAGPDDAGAGFYETLDKPARAELLALMQRFGVRALFAGHSHQPFYNRLAGADLWTLPSTTSARTFGRAYRLRPDAIIYDEQRLGYVLARVFPDRYVVTPIDAFPRAYPAAPAQAGNFAPLKRFAPRVAAEQGDQLFGVVAGPPPRPLYGQWNAAYVTDGDARADDTRDDVWRGWTSGEHQSAGDEEWVAVELWAELTVSRVEIAARPKGWRFPPDFVIELSLDGVNWSEVARRAGFRAFDGPISISFVPQPARYVRLRSLHLAGAPPYRMSIMELSVFGPDGVNLALGCRAFARSSAEDEPYVDDLAWHMPARLGASWVRLHPADWAWPAIEPLAGQQRLTPAQQRALGMGRPPGLRLIMPLGTTHPAYADAASRQSAFGAYVRFLAQNFGDALAGWQVLNAGQPAAELAALTDEARRQLDAVGHSGRLAAGPFYLRDEEAIRAVAGKVDALLFGLDISADDAAIAGQLSACVRLAARSQRPAEPWAELSLGAAGDLVAPLIGKRLARAFVLAQAAGVRCFWGHRPGEAGGLLDRANDPTETYWTAHALTAVFDAGDRPLGKGPLQVKARARGNATLKVVALKGGARRLVVALWQSAPPQLGDVEPVETELTVSGLSAGRVLGIDALSGAGQDLQWETAGGATRLAGLLVRDYPLLVALWPAGALPLILKQ